MELDHLKTLLALVARGSVSAAADDLATSRGTVRRRLDELEAAVGVPLVVRDEAGVRPTAAGEALVGRGAALVDQAAIALRAVRETGNEPSGVVRVAAMTGMPPHLFPVMFALIGMRYPRLRIELRVLEDPLAEAVTEADLTLHFGARPREGAYVSRVITRMPERLVASEAYLAMAGRPERVEDLHQHRLFVWRSPGGDATRLPTLGSGGVAVQPHLICSDVHMLRVLAQSGVGIAFTPDRGIDASDATPLVPVLPELIGRECALRYSAPEALVRVPKVRAVMDLLAEFTAGFGEVPG
jgi:DNA-binding transcriptional LysR family regulator